jgi:2'-5' RNA ligase
MKFLGSISPEVLEKLSLAITPVVAAWSPFDLRIHGLGCFPSIRNPRVLWAGIAQGGAEASSLQKAIEDKSTELGLQPGDRPFHPHLTLGRVRSPKGRGLLAEAVESHKDAEVGTFRVSEVYLFKSELRPSGAVYSKLRTFPMGGSQE